MLIRWQMGPSVWRAGQHGRVWPHPDAAHGCQRRGCVCDDGRWREGCAGHTASAEEGGAPGPGVRGYPVAPSRDGLGGCERCAGGCEPAVQLCQWRDDPGDGGKGHVVAKGVGSAYACVDVGLTLRYTATWLEQGCTMPAHAACCVLCAVCCMLCAQRRSFVNRVVAW